MPFEFYLDNDHATITRDLVYTTIATAAAHALLTPLAMRTAKKKHWIDVLDLYYHVLYIPILIVCSWFVVTQHGDSVRSRWHSNDGYSYIFLLLYIAENFVHVPILYYSKDTTRQMFWLYLLHHFVSTVSYGVGLYTTRLHFFACLDGLCEVSSFLVNVMLTWQALEWKRGIVYTVLGLSLWLSYVVFRLSLFPYWFYLFFTDIYSDPAITWDAVTHIERYFFVFATTVLCILSVTWFIPITKGLIKAVKNLKRA